MDAAIETKYGPGRGDTCLVTADGERICYTVCNRGLGILFIILTALTPT